MPFVQAGTGPRRQREAAGGKRGHLGQIGRLLLRERLIDLLPRYRAHLDQHIALLPPGARHLGEALPEHVDVDEPGREQYLPSGLNPPKD